MYDAIIVGGGVAGLQAALTLGRMHRTALLLDSGEYRNGTVAHAHNLITHDGHSPADIRRLARAEIAAYATVEVRDAAATAVAPDGGDFVVTVDGAPLRTRTVVLATGLHDELPDIPGLAAQWGDRAANCPFCHGHESAGGRVAIVSASPQAAMLASVAGAIVVLDPATVTEVRPVPSGLLLTLADGGTEEVAGVFATPSSTQRAPFAAQLGLAMQGSGAVRVDAYGRTSLEGVYAAGDMAHSDAFPGPNASLAGATAAGQLAAVAVVQRFAAERMASSAG